jgi:hypothetical protein
MQTHLHLFPQDNLVKFHWFEIFCLSEGLRDFCLQNLLKSCLPRTETLTISVYSGLLFKAKNILSISCYSFVLSIFHPVNQALEENKAKESQFLHTPGK